MRTIERLRAIRDWAQSNLCEGRQMKAPGKDMHITDIRTQEPRVFIGWQPALPMELRGLAENGEAETVCPAITIMLAPSDGKKLDERRFDAYNHIARPKSLGRTLCVTMLFSVYEPGIRMPGFVTEGEDGETEIDMEKYHDGTEAGQAALMDWMDECMDLLIAQHNIPDSDLTLHEDKLTYSLYTDQNYVVDRRPIYYGFVNAEFGCYADNRAQTEIEQYLT